ncbi:amidohydrolase family protein [Exophiala viscosa]|uniref:amidohydrolase family protein n=1 Tax=Exophiala viscosa TaxID=2486360 RepID=UPI00219C8002|nr:amidohydrolase family protein [Exophiala viscosa]
MDDAGVTLQVVSHAPNSLALDTVTCAKVNNELAGLIKFRPKRFAGFATLPMAHPEDAGEELRRCVQQLGFVGALIDSNCEARFYDNAHFWPVFKAAEELDVPNICTPLRMSRPNIFYTMATIRHLLQSVSASMAGVGTNETAIHLLRLFAAGLFDRYPKLKLVLGHLGEMLPFQLDRIEGITARQWPFLGLKLERHLRQVWDEYVWITTSGMFHLAPMAAVLRQCKPDRIIYIVDYPFSSNVTGLEFLKTLKTEGLVSDEVLGGIAYRNAERLLKFEAVSS